MLMVDWTEVHWTDRLIHMKETLTYFKIFVYFLLMILLLKLNCNEKMIYGQGWSHPQLAWALAQA